VRKTKLEGDGCAADILGIAADMNPLDLVDLESHPHQRGSALGYEALVDVILMDPVADLPAITVPAGYADTGQPLPEVFTALHLGEGKLISVAYAFEQTTHARQEPDLDATMQQIEQMMGE